MSAVRAPVCLALAALVAAAAAPAANAPVTIQAQIVRDPATFGPTLRLTGVAGTRAGEHVDVLQKECGYQFFRIIGGTQTGVGGTWRYETWLDAGGRFRARSGGKLSRAITMRAPLAPYAIQREGTRKWDVSVSTYSKPVPMDGKVVELQRLHDGQWLRVRRQRLHKVDGGYATVFTIRTRGLTLRAMLPPESAPRCYYGAASKTFRS